MIYLDNAATTQVCPEAAAAALEAMTQSFGNPSATYALGRQAHEILERARTVVARALGCDSAEVYFTSCGSEGDNWAIGQGALLSHTGKHVISSQTEHAAVLRSLDALESRGFTVTRLAPGPDGAVTPEAVQAALRSDTALVSLMLVNNETGARTDIEKIAKLVHAQNPRTIVHTDAVQAFCKIPFSVHALNVDMATISGHKFHAPKGVGALYLRKGLPLKSLIVGGSQEAGRRAGTEPIPQIAAMASAIDAASGDYITHFTHLRTLCQETLTERIPDIRWLSPDSAAPHILSLSLPGYRSEVLMNALDAQEIYVSRSSACRKGARSHVLTAMGEKPAVIDGALRLSFSRFTTQEEVYCFCEALAQLHDRLRPSLRR